MKKTRCKKHFWAYKIDTNETVCLECGDVFSPVFNHVWESEMLIAKSDAVTTTEFLTKEEFEKRYPHSFKDVFPKR